MYMAATEWLCLYYMESRTRKAKDGTKRTVANVCGHIILFAFLNVKFSVCCCGSITAYVALQPNAFFISTEHSTKLLLYSFQCFFHIFFTSSVPFILIVVFHVRSNLTFNNNLMSTSISRVQRVSHKHTHTFEELSPRKMLKCSSTKWLRLHRPQARMPFNFKRIHGQRRTNDGGNSYPP